MSSRDRADVLDLQLVTTDTTELLEALSKRFADVELGMDGWTDQSERNANVRFARWTGQTRDGRKQGKDAFPWKGASDIQSFDVDTKVNEDVALLMTALWESDITAIAHKPESAGDAGGAARFLRWLKGEIKELDDAAELSANTMLQSGIMSMGIFWMEETEIERREITADQLAQFDNALFIMVGNPDTEDDAVEALQNIFPRGSKKEIRKAVKEIRETGKTEIMLPTVVKSRPGLRSYVLGEDLFIPAESMETTKVTPIFQVDWLEPNEIRQRVNDEGWDADWAEDVIERGRGADSFTNDLQRHRIERRFHFGALDNKIKVVTAYYRASDKNNIPGWYFSIFHARLRADVSGTPQMAKQGLLNFRPSRHPFVFGLLEVVGRRVLDSRGYGETGRPAQNQIKLEIDSRIDNSSMSTVPAMEYIAGRKPPEYGPGRKIPVRRRNEVGWVETPPSTNKSSEVENTIRLAMNRQFGRATPDSDPARVSAQQRRLIRRWLHIWEKIFNHCWQLFAQFGDEVTYFQVLGPSAQESMESFENKGATFDFHLRFDENRLNNEQLLEEYRTIGDIAQQFDQKGEVNTSQLLRDILSAINPQIAERVIQPPQVAQQTQIQDEQKMLTQMWSGFDVEVPQNNVDATLRLQVVESWLKGSDDIPAEDVQGRLENDQAFAARIQKHVQQLEFILTQQRNAGIGRRGTEAGNAQASPADGQQPQLQA